MTDVPATDSIKQGITHATGFIYNANGGVQIHFRQLDDGSTVYL